jgi:hypothetical protein
VKFHHKKPGSLSNAVLKTQRSLLFRRFDDGFMGPKQPRGKVSPWSTGALPVHGQGMKFSKQECRLAVEAIQAHSFRQALGA